MNTARMPSNPDIAAITAPAPLRDLPAWLVWRREWDPKARQGAGQWRKTPFWVNGRKRYGQHGRAEDRAQLTTFEIAKAAAMRRGFDGVGFAPLPEFGVCAIDFDHCIEAGRIRQDVLQAVEGTYAEVSPSGTGVRAFVRGAFGNRKNHEVGFEVFSTAGFVTVTGQRLEIVDLLDLHDEVAEPAPALRGLVARCFGREEQAEAGTGDTPPIGLTEAQLREALDVLDPEDGGYWAWVRVGMALHHETGGRGLHLWDEWSSRGSTYPGAQVLASKWEGFGRGDQRPVTAHALIRLANEHGAHIDLTDQALADFDVVEAPPPAPAKPPRFAVVPDTEFMARPAPRWIVKGLVPEGELLVLFGESTAGKSFVALDVFGAVARGVSWRGLRVSQRRVCFVIAEGGGGFRNRLHAYQQHHGAPPGVQVMHAVPNLLQHDDAVDVAKAIQAAGGADIVVIDTFAQATAGANENAAEDMGKALGHCRGISRALGGALVVLVHHAGKDTSKGARGWSGLKAAADAEIEVVRAPAGRYIRTSKQKDGEDGGMWGFDLQVVTIGADDDGDAVTSCIVAEAAVPTRGRIEPVRKLGEVESVVDEVIREFAVAQSAGIEKAAVLTEVVARLAAPTSDSMRDTRKQRAARALTRLLADDESPYVDDGDGTLSVV